MKSQKRKAQMVSGLERAPIYPGMPVEAASQRGRESAMAFGIVLKHTEWLEGYLGVDTDSPFKVDAAAIKARHEQLEGAKSNAHSTTRGIHQLGMLLVGTVNQMSGEFARKRVLDIGAGEGRFGAELTRKARAKMTYLDHDRDILSTIPASWGDRIAASGYALPFKDEAFPRTVAAFSSLPWAKTPQESVNALNEALRVTEVGGTVFLPPFLSNIMKRHAQTNQVAISDLPSREVDTNERLGLKVWAAQDYALIGSLLNLIAEDYCSVTWSGYIAKGVNTGEVIESYTAIIDKNKSIPPKVFADNLDFANQFMSVESSAQV
jgi:hypothetical protein